MTSALFLATFNVQTTHSPGDDGMRREPPERHIRIVEAESEDAVETIVKLKYEVDKPYVLLIEVSGLKITPVLGWKDVGG